MADRKPKASIALPVYNGEEFLSEALDSWIAQDFEDFELIVSDNASTDGTPDILDDYQKRDNRIRVIRRKETVPVTPNYNDLVAEARAEYFAWTADDDLQDPTYLTKLIDALEKRPEVVIAYPQMKRFHGEVSNAKKVYYAKAPPGTEATPAARFSSLLRRGTGWGMIYGIIRMSALQKTRLFVVPMGLAPDVGLTLELATYGPLHCVPEVLLYLRIHDNCLHLTQDDPMYNDGRGRIVDDETRAFIDGLNVDEGAKALLLRELTIWCKKWKRNRPGWMKIPGVRWAYVEGGRGFIDLTRRVKGL